MAGILIEAVMRIAGLKAYARCVFANLADRANLRSRQCWPSVARIAADTCMSVRQVNRSLDTLRELKFITVVGRTIHGTNVYRLNIAISPKVKQHASSLPNGQGATDQQAEDICQSDTSVLPISQTNKVSEKNKKQGNGSVKTSDANALLAYSPDESVGGKSGTKISISKKKGGLVNNKSAYEPESSIESSATIGEKPQSQLASAWKTAHKKAGLPIPELTPTQCTQLKNLAAGNDALDYLHVRDKLIPETVSRWQDFCTYANYKGVHFKSKAPMPLRPNTGFLARYKAIADEFVQLSGEQWDNMMAMLQDGKDVKFGAMPKGIPKPTGWNSAAWKGHQNEE